MSVKFEAPGGGSWQLTCTPQCLTDIQVEVSNPYGQGPPLFSFRIGKLLLDEIDNLKNQSMFTASADTRREVMLRWAEQMEIYGRLVKASLARELPGRG